MTRIELKEDDIGLDISNYHDIFSIQIFGKLKDEKRAEQLKKQILEDYEFRSKFKLHYTGDTYLVNYDDTWYIPTCAGDLQTAEDDLELFNDKTLQQLGDFKRFEEWAVYKELKEKADKWDRMRVSSKNNYANVEELEAQVKELKEEKNQKNKEIVDKWNVIDINVLIRAMEERGNSYTAQHLRTIQKLQEEKYG